jgi:hypothetical protein
MFSSDYIIFSIFYIFILSFSIESYIHKKYLGKIILFAGLVACIYCISAGVHFLGGWVDPLSGMDARDRGVYSAKAGGRGGILLLAISLWPYVLIGFGSVFGFAYLRGFFVNNSLANDPNQ